MDRQATVRLPPRVVFVPPPGGPTIPRRRLVGMLCWFGLASAILGVVAYFSRASVWACALLGAFFFIVLTSFFLRVSGLHGRRRRRQRAEFLEKHPDWEQDPNARLFVAAWDPPDPLPSPAKVRAAAEAFAQVSEDRACVVCFGHVKIPEVGDFHFEPEIITPTGSLWRSLAWLLSSGGILILWLFDDLRWLPGWFPPIRNMIGGFSYVLVSGFVVLVIWIWRGMIRPTYIRIAPGIIQVLVYGFSRSKPTIREYPIQAGTVVYFTRVRKRLTLTLMRDGLKDKLVLTSMRDARRIAERALEAIFSTAPIPPLSRDELLG